MASAPSVSAATFQLRAVYDTHGGDSTGTKVLEVPVGTNASTIAGMLAQFWPEADAVTIHPGRDQDPYEDGLVLRDAATAAELGDLTVLAKVVFPESYFEN